MSKKRVAITPPAELASIPIEALREFLVKAGILAIEKGYAPMILKEISSASISILRKKLAALEMTSSETIALPSTTSAKPVQIQSTINTQTEHPVLLEKPAVTESMVIPDIKEKQVSVFAQPTEIQDPVIVPDQARPPMRFRHGL